MRNQGTRHIQECYWILGSLKKKKKKVNWFNMHISKLKFPPLEKQVLSSQPITILIQEYQQLRDGVFHEYSTEISRCHTVQDKSKGILWLFSLLLLELADSESKKPGTLKHAQQPLGSPYYTNWGRLEVGKQAKIIQEPVRGAPSKSRGENKGQKEKCL